MTLETLNEKSNAEELLLLTTFISKHRNYRLAYNEQQYKAYPETCKEEKALTLEFEGLNSTAEQICSQKNKP